MNWIDVNLPWSFKVDMPPIDFQQIINARIIDTFGKSIEQMASELLPEDTMSFINKFDDEVRKYVNEHSGDINNRTDILSAREVVYQRPCFRALKIYREFVKNVNAWEYEQPEWIDWRIKCELLRAEERTKSFSGLNLNKPGTLIEINNNGSIEQYLIGDVNTNRGVCDDCTAFASDVIVLRYAIVFEPFN